MADLKRALVIMAKRPEPGHTKTRLCPPLSAATAACLYECFLRDTLHLARSLPGVTPLIAFTPPAAETYFHQLAPDLPRLHQSGVTLGARLEGVLTHCLAAGFAQAAAIGSDSPTLPAPYLTAAFDRLADPAIDLVLGPSEDGGYYLIGWKRPYPHLVRDVTMSTPQVLQDTLALAAQAGVRVALLPPWYDIDEAADLARLRTELAAHTAVAPHTRSFLTGFQIGSISRREPG